MPRCGCHRKSTGFRSHILWEEFESRKHHGAGSCDKTSASSFLNSGGSSRATTPREPISSRIWTSSSTEVNDEARNAGAMLVLAGRQNHKQKTFIYVNNRLEGNALETIDAMLSHIV